MLPKPVRARWNRTCLVKNPLPSFAQEALFEYFLKIVSKGLRHKPETAKFILKRSKS